MKIVAFTITGVCVLFSVLLAMNKATKGAIMFGAIWFLLLAISTLLVVIALK